MKYAPHPVLLLAGLVGLLTSSAGRPAPWRWNGAWPASVHAELMAAGALALAVIACALLWRQRQWARTLRQLRAQLSSERSLRRGAEQALGDTHAQLCRLARQQQQVRDEERQRIARDVHDDLGQHLLGLTIDLSTLQADPSLPAAARARLAQIERQQRLALASLRGLIHNLRPAALDAGLRAAIERQLAEFRRISGIPCALRADDAAFSLAPDSERETVLYRVLQEALSNIARHARASAVQVALQRLPACLCLTVSDNGVGLPAQPAQLPERGCGLLGMEERIRQAGGRFHLASQPGLGTVLTISLPLAVAVPA